MRNSLIRHMSAFFQENKFEEISRLARPYIVRFPQDTQIRYLEAFAYFCQGKLDVGLAHFSALISLYAELLKKGCLSQRERVLAAEVGLQCAAVSKFAGMDQNTERHWRLAIRFVSDILSDKGQDNLRKQLQEMVSHQLPWVRKDADTVISRGTFLILGSPLVLQIEPTNYCNLRCKMCPYAIMRRPKGYLSAEELRRIITGWSFRSRKFLLKNLFIDSVSFELVKSGVIKLFFMGEPLLHAQLEDLISAAKSEGIHVGIQTNGILLQDRRIRDRLFASCPDAISISLDGLDKASYESLRDGAHWENIQAGIEAFACEREQRGLKERIHFSITTIVADATFISQQKARQFLSAAQPYVDNILFNILNRQYEGDFLDSTGRIAPYSIQPKPRFSLDEPVCTEALYKMNILWDGKAVACCYDIDGKYLLGDTKEEEVDNIWKGQRARALRQAILGHDFSDFGLCQVCTSGQQANIKTGGSYESVGR